MTVARKPLIGTVSQNALEWGTGGLNIDGSRISTTDNLNGGAYAEATSDRPEGYENWRFKRGDKGNVGGFVPPSGRWPANLILVHDAGCTLAGTKKVPGSHTTGTTHGRAGSPVVYGGGWAERDQVRATYDDEDGMETVEAWACVEGCPVKQLDSQGITSTTGMRSITSRENIVSGTSWYVTDHRSREYPNDKGTASRFFVQVGSRDA